METRLSDVYDMVIIVGEDQEKKSVNQRYCKELVEECKRRNLRYHLVGDGKTGATLENLKKLPHANHAVIIAHSKISVEGKHHFVLNRNEDSWEKLQTLFSYLPKPGAYPSIDVIKSVQASTGATSLVVGSCYAAKISSELKEIKARVLLPETRMLIASPSNEASYIDDTMLILKDLLKKIPAGNKANMCKLGLDSIKLNPNTMDFVYQPADDKKSIVSHTIRRTDRAKDELCLQVPDYCRYQSEVFSEFAVELSKIIPNSSILLAEISSFPITFQMTQLEIQNYHKRSFERHVAYNDYDVVERLLSKIEITAMFYMKVLCDAIDETLTKNDKLIPMVKLLLEHKEKTLNWEGNPTFNEGIERHINFKGFNPLTLAIEHEHIEIVELLLKHGANATMADSKERIPADMMRDNIKFNDLCDRYLNLIDSSHKQKHI